MADDRPAKRSEAQIQVTRQRIVLLAFMESSSQQSIVVLQELNPVATAMTKDKISQRIVSLEPTSNRPLFLIFFRPPATWADASIRQERGCDGGQKLILVDRLEKEGLCAGIHRLGADGGIVPARQNDDTCGRRKIAKSGLYF